MSEVIKVEKIRKVFLDDLPRGGLNRGDRINWENSKGHRARFIYDDIEDWVEIVGYDCKTEYIYIKYSNNEPFKIKIGNFKNCLLGKMLKTNTSDFKIEIGQLFKDDKRNLIIIDREYRIRYKKDNSKCNDKYYKYKCAIDGNEDWMVESSLLSQSKGCNVCANKKVLLGVNTIWDTDKWMIPIINDDEFCKTHTHSCGDRIIPTCPNCGRTLNKSSKVSNIYNFRSIGCICSDKISYGEKVFYNVLEQLGIGFITQLSKTNFKWCKDYLYDFYINNYNILIEIHGEQHYVQTTRKNARSLEEEQSNDKLKQELALVNNIEEENYIIIDCRESNLEFIKNNILNSNLSDTFDLSIIDWDKVQKFALGTRVKEACDLWNSGIESTKEIATIMKVCYSTICKWLTRGYELNWCTYNGRDELIKSASKNGKTGMKPVICLENGKIFESAMDLERKSLEEFGTKLFHGSVSNVLNGKTNKYKGLSFKYISSLTKNDKIKYNIM